MLRGMLLAYADMTLERTKLEDEFLKKILVSVHKHLLKHRVKVNSQQKFELNRLTEICRVLDADYFEGKDFSPYLVFFALLEFMVIDLNNTELRCLVFKQDIAKIRSIIDESQKLKEVNLDTHKYITKVYETLQKKG